MVVTEADQVAFETSRFWKRRDEYEERRRTKGNDLHGTKVFQKHILPTSLDSFVSKLEAIKSDPKVLTGTFGVRQFKSVLLNYPSADLAATTLAKLFEASTRLQPKMTSVLDEVGSEIELYCRMEDWISSAEDERQKRIRKGRVDGVRNKPTERSKTLVKRAINEDGVDRVPSVCDA